MLTQQDLLRGLHAQGKEARVDDWMQRDVPSADIGERLEGLLERLQRSKSRLLTVTAGGEPAGTVNGPAPLTPQIAKSK